MTTPNQNTRQCQATKQRVHVAEDVELEPYISWATLDGRVEHVSYTNFVEKFNLQDQIHSQRLYEKLIESTQFRQSRRIRLKKKYDVFLKQGLDDYWRDRILSLERSKTRIHSATTAARTARLAQDASLYESSLGFQTCHTQDKDSLQDGHYVSETSSLATLKSDGYRSNLDDDIAADDMNSPGKGN
ncbi:hypothetical protein BGZ49_001014, partial [Haplosporangium sp. Z 27]